MNILVVDDDRQIVRTTCDILHVKGYETLAAYSGEEALAKFGAEPPDCVLMDIKMPGLSGVEALRRMKALAPDVPVVLVSAYVTDDLLAEAKQAGAYGVLAKPLNIQLILSFLELLRKEESVMIVDDDPAFFNTLKDILSLRGFRVNVAEHAGKVMAGLETEHQLVILLDLKLGAASGLDVLKEIRRKYPSKPVVLVTGHRQDMTGVIEDGLQIGAHACLYKPLEIEDLLRMIEEIRVAKLRHLLM